jgi:Lipocalin-like domain
VCLCSQWRRIAKRRPSQIRRIPNAPSYSRAWYAYSGTYKTEGNNKLVSHVDGSWNQSWTGTDVVRQVEITGTKVLTITTPPFKSVMDGQEIVVTTTYERE